MGIIDFDVQRCPQPRSRPAVGETGLFLAYYFNKMDPKQTLHFKVTADNLVKQNLRDGRTTASRTYGAKLLVA